MSGFGRRDSGFQPAGGTSLAPWAPVQSTSGVTGTIAYTSTTTAGTLLVLGLLSITNVTAVSDNVNGAWTLVLQESGVSGVFASLWFHANGAGGVLTFTASGFSGNNWCLGEASGIATSSPLDQSTENFLSPGAGTAFSVGPLGPLSGSGEMVVGCAWCTNPTISSPGTGQTQWAEAANTFALTYLTASGTAGPTMNWASTSISNWAGVLAAFKL